MESEAEKSYYNYNDFLKTVIDRNVQQDIDIELEIESQIVNVNPKLQIEFNNEILSDELVSPGVKIYKFTVKTPVSITSFIS